MKIKITDIDYNITDEDIESAMEDYDYDPDTDDIDTLANQALEEIVAALPTEMEIEIPTEYIEKFRKYTGELESYLAECISLETGFCINWYDYKIVEE